MRLERAMCQKGIFSLSGSRRDRRSREISPIGGEARDAKKKLLSQQQKNAILNAQNPKKSCFDLVYLKLVVLLHLLGAPVRVSSSSFFFAIYMRIVPHRSVVL